MEHMAWKGRIKPGCKAEYQRRHAEIWPEMVKVLKEAGICNYSIFYCKDELFGYYECLQRFPHCEAALLPAFMNGTPPSTNIFFKCRDSRFT